MRAMTDFVFLVLVTDRLLGRGPMLCGIGLALATTLLLFCAVVGLDPTHLASRLFHFCEWFVAALH